MVKAMIGIGLAMLLGYCVIRSSFQLGINLTPSEPKGLYLLLPIRWPIMPHQLVVFELSDKGGLKRLLKEVLAVPGDKIFTLNKAIYNCKNTNFSVQCELLGKCLDFTAQAKALSCQFWRGEKIPEGYYYLGSNKIKNSFDSRYFGLVVAQQIKQNARLIIGFYP